MNLRAELSWKEMMGIGKHENEEKLEKARLRRMRRRTAWLKKNDHVSGYKEEYRGEGE